MKFDVVCRSRRSESEDPGGLLAPTGGGHCLSSCPANVVLGFQERECVALEIDLSELEWALDKRELRCVGSRRVEALVWEGQEVM